MRGRLPSGFRAAAALLLVLTVFSTPSPGAEPFRLTADSMEYLRGNVMVARGHVAISGSGLEITGDELTYDRDRERVVLKGNVVMKEGTRGAFSGEELSLSLADLTGGMKNGSLTVAGTNLTMTGDRIERIGPDEFEVEGGTFSTCPPGLCQDWSFRARHIRVEKEGYLTARGSSFYIAGVPVFYSPLLLFPVKTGRQAGLLVPEVGFSERNGAEGAFPAFLPLGGAADLTLTPRTFSRAPDGGEAEARYRAPRGGGGEWSGFALAGKELPGQWFARGRHAVEAFPGGWTRLRWYGAGDEESPGRFARTGLLRDPGAVLSLAALDVQAGPVGLWGVESRLLADAREWSSSAGLARRRAGGSLGRVWLGPAGVAAEGEWVRFGPAGEGGERRTVSPSIALDLRGPGPLIGELAATWTESAGEGGRRGFSLASFRQQVALEKELSPGTRHRLGLDLAVTRASSASFAGTARDAGDGSRSASLVFGEAVSEIAGSAFSFRVRGGGWREEEAGEAQGFGEVTVGWSALSLSAMVNPDGELAGFLPNPGFTRPDGKGWKATALLSGEKGEVGVSRERMTASDSLRGRFRLPLARWDLSGKADYDLVAGRMVESEAAVRLKGPCWWVEVTARWKPSGNDWRTSFSLTQ